MDILVGTRVRRKSSQGRKTEGVVIRILPATYRLPAEAKVRWEDATRRFSGTTHTTSTMRLSNLVAID